MEGDICIHTVDSLHWTAETCTTLKSNYTPIKKESLPQGPALRAFTEYLHHSFDLQSPSVRDSVCGSHPRSFDRSFVCSLISSFSGPGSVLNTTLNRCLHFISLMWEVFRKRRCFAVDRALYWYFRTESLPQFSCGKNLHPHPIHEGAGRRSFIKVTQLVNGRIQIPTQMWFPECVWAAEPSVCPCS